MAFMARVKELGRSIAGIDETDELNIIDENDEIDENKVKDIIMIDPRAMELLKTWTSLGKNEEKVGTGIADTNDASPNEKENGEFKRSLDVMKGILQRGKQTEAKGDDKKIKDSTERIND